MGFGSALGSLAGSMLGDAFGAKQDRRGARSSIRAQSEATRELRQTSFQDLTSSAKAAGLHPLFALGAGAGGGSPGFSIPGQSATGSGTKQALTNIGKMIGSKFDGPTNLVNAQAALSAVELARHSISNDVAQNIPPHMTIPAHRAKFQEIKKGEVDTHVMGKPEQSTNVKSPMTRVRIGSQDIWVPVEEVDEFMENPLSVGALTAAYHGNKDVNWTKVMKDYTGRRSLTEYMRDNIREFIPIKLRKKHLLKKYAKQWAGGPSP